ncbi:6-phosphogluconolactonase [Paenibacillus thermoaerophilus]|uniref:6-phosphogluconolactonase n=1 Tax=Paenibacillus thermoaerophilus TaxID=1215385 RepID=A0ABW2V2A1_9BACL|nr:glucosamine-6-phosphate deaminase [Paenibacillus thermoaerophilus]TMV06737.1 glucosamine-6-phosphate deaminase [Paenibacillus thermoaerophilus]
MDNLNVGNLEIRRYESRTQMGEAVAHDLAAHIRQVLKSKDFVSIVFASAPSQLDFLESLRRMEDVPWDRIHGFHLDEYIGLSQEAPQSFSRFLRDQLFNYRTPHVFHALDGLNDPQQECKRYAELLKQTPLDIACIGIGENGHIAFNDPHVADFEDPQAVKVVALDETSRQQQVNDGCFAALEEVPTEALTLTIPSIMAAPAIFCTVPGSRKSRAVRETVYGPIDVSCPASILRKANRCYLYLDRESALYL